MSPAPSRFANEKLNKRPLFTVASSRFLDELFAQHRAATQFLSQFQFSTGKTKKRRHVLIATAAAAATSIEIKNFYQQIVALLRLLYIDIVI